MRIDFQHVLPVPLADTPLSEHSCWKKEISFDSTGKYMVEAPSGTGKTTLVSILYGTRPDYEGKVLFDGKDIRGFTTDEWVQIRREKFAAVFQDLRLFPQLSAIENIRIKNELTSTLKEEEILQMAETLGIAHRMNQPCGKLSLGQQQRVAIIRALAQPFSFILLDEPFSHLDEENSAKACRMISESCERNKAGLLLTSLGPDSHFEFTGTITI